MEIKHRKALVLIGATMIVSPLSMFSYYGNLLPYLISYFQARRDQMTMYMDPLWPSTVFRASFSFSMIFTTPLELRFGIRPVKAAGLLVLYLSVLSGYFSVKEPLALTLTFGLTHGLAVGVIYSLTLKLVLQTMDNKGGLGTGLMATGPAYGSLINIGIAYAVINPHNKKADLKVGNSVYFSDPSIISRVPFYFLAVGCFVIIITSLGFILMYIGSRSNQAPGGNSATFSTKYNSLEETNNKSEDIPLEILSEKTKEASPPAHPEMENRKGAMLTNNGRETLSIHKDQESDSLKENEPSKTETQVLDSSMELSPREIVRTRQFWWAWLCSLALNHTAYVHLNLYKQYGQLAISNDFVLVLAGLISTAAMIITRPMVGLCSDRFGILNTTTALCACSSLFIALLVLVIHTVPGLYVPLAIVEFLCVSMQVLVFSLLTSSLFGKIHYASNNGLINSGQLLLIFAEPFMVAAMVERIGWDWVFISGSVAAAIAMVSVMAIDRKSVLPYSS